MRDITKRTPIRLFKAQAVGNVPADWSRYPGTEMPEGEWELATWPRDTDPTEHIVGLLYWGSPTHYAYCLDDSFRPAGVIAQVARHGRFYFDAGGNGRPIWAVTEDLAQAFVDLGLLATDWASPSEGDASDVKRA